MCEAKPVCQWFNVTRHRGSGFAIGRLAGKGMMSHWSAINALRWKPPDHGMHTLSARTFAYLCAQPWYRQLHGNRSSVAYRDCTPWACDPLQRDRVVAGADWCALASVVRYMFCATAWCRFSLIVMVAQTLRTCSDASLLPYKGNISVHVCTGPRWTKSLTCWSSRVTCNRALQLLWFYWVLRVCLFLPND
jgi:hypothetical protein